MSSAMLQTLIPGLALALAMVVPGLGEAAVTVQGSAGVGYRHDRLTWSIAGDRSGKNPDVLSELEWQVDSLALTGDLRLLLGNTRRPSDSGPAAPQEATTDSAAFCQLWGGYGFIYDGDNRDSDYAGNGRTGEYSRSESDADDGYLYDLTVALGWQVNHHQPDGTILSIAPFLGYGYSKQALTLTEGRQTLASPGTPPHGTIAGLDSKYTAEWDGPLLGATLRYVHPGNEGEELFSLWLEVLYSRVDYEGEGVWNLRTDFAQDPSFRHTAEGDGWTVTTGAAYRFTRHSALGADLTYRRWLADENGVDRLYFADGTKTAKTRFNEAEWEMWSVVLRYQHHF